MSGLFDLLRRLFGYQRYTRVTHEDGGSFVSTPAEAEEFLQCQNAMERREYEITDVWLTPEEFEAIDEFCGF